MARHMLVLGGARSGKTAFAERVALATSTHPVYLATGEAHDAEMSDRIAAHRTARDARFTTIEEPRDLTGALHRLPAGTDLVLIDCLTLWLTNLLLADVTVETQVEALCDALKRTDTPPLLIVSNEIGLSVVPDNALARRFADLNGLANQRLAVNCDDVLFVAAGLPLVLKGALPKLEA